MSPEQEPIDRRGFARLVTAGMSGTVLGFTANVALAQVTKPEDPPQPPSLAALLLAAVVTDCPGDHWDEETLESVLNDIRGDQARSRQLSAFPLTNGDDPATIFVAPSLPHDKGNR